MKTITEKRTRFGTYKIVDQTYNDRPARILYAGRATPQSGVALDEKTELLFDYIQRLFEVALSVQPQRVLVIGGGAFTLPRALLERTNVERVDVVEIDAELPEIAHAYFGLPRDERLRVFSMDGRDYCTNSTDRYDLIIIDAFDEYDIPRSLMTQEATREYARLLTKSGVIAMNFIGYYRGLRTQATRELAVTFQANLPYVELFPADNSDSKYEEQNLILVASKSRLPDLPYMQSTEVDVPS